MPNSHTNALPIAAAAQSLEDLAIKSGIPSEHVLIEGEEILEHARQRTSTVRQRLRFHNRIRGAKTAFILFDDDYLTIREHRNGKPLLEHTVDLRYLDPKPMRSRSVARTALHVTLWLLGLSFLMGTLAYSAVLPNVTALIGMVSVIVTAAAFALFVRRTEEHVTFRTQHGRAIVLTIVANFGCFRASRVLARKIATSIGEARRRNTQDKQRLLREEMREHYRLSEAGVLSAEACAAATRRTLGHFD